MVRWTRFIIAHRKRVLLAWLVLVIAAGTASAGLADLLSNRFSIPGSEAEQGFDVLKKEFGEQGVGYTAVFRVEPDSGVAGAALTANVQKAVDRGAKAVKGKAGPVQVAGDDVLFAQITTSLEDIDAAEATPDLRKAIGQVEGAERFVTGMPAITHDTEPLYEEDLVKGEKIALPIALLVLAFMLGTVMAIGVPLLFAFVTIPVTLGGVWVFAHFMDMAAYVQNIVTLIGIAIAIDYSMLIVFRYREELRKCDGSCDVALVETMRTAGHATVFSGISVALGLALLVLMPLPFMQSMGVGGLLVPLVSIAACLTFLPALLSVMGHKINRFRVIPKSLLEKRAQAETGAWATLARAIMRRPVVFLAVSMALLLALAYPVTDLKLTGGDNRGYPKTVEATKGLALLESTLGPGTLAPTQIVVDTGKPGGAWSAESRAQQQDLASYLGGDAEIAAVDAPARVHSGEGTPPPEVLALARKANLVDADSRFIQIRAPGRHDTGSEEAQDLVERIRDDYLPESGIAASQVWVTGAPAFGVDFIDVAYGAFPYLVIAVLLLTYLVLLRAFRSVVLPAKAVLMNVLSVAATYGALVLVFQHGIGADVVGWQESPQIEAWIPVMLFAILFGLSMDYEVFLLSRMREEWDKGLSNDEAVQAGIQHTGRIITAAAVIMIAAFAGFTAGQFVNLQMFGFGLSAAILLDATLVRTILVPSVMKLLGDWNWYLPDSFARFVRTVERPVAPPPPGEVFTVTRARDLLRVDTDWNERVVRIALEGELDLATHERLALALEKAEAEDPELVVIELAGLTYLDSAGLRELVGAQRRARAAGRRFVLMRGSEPVERLLEITGLATAFEREVN